MDSNVVLAVASVVASVALAIFTAVLAWATVAYARRTAETVSEMKLQARPVLVLTPDLLGGVAPLVRLSNIGKGAALNIGGQLTIAIKGTITWTYELRLDLMSSGDFYRLHPLQSDEHLSVHQMVEGGYEYGATLTYADSQGGQYRLVRNVTWRDITEHLFGANVLIPAEPYAPIIEELRQVRRALEKLEPRG